MSLTYADVCRRMLTYADAFAGMPTKKTSGQQQIVLFNHLRFTILMHQDAKKGTERVVGFEVEPFSVKHTYMNKIDFEECVGEQAG